MSDLFEEKKNTQSILIEDSMRGSYLDYSMSVIIGRALPDARDGLKPVHRRILYSMKDLNIGSKTPYKKSARIVGHAIGLYHPHGDTAVYDAMVRMAQSFSMRSPLIDGQGNFGSIDGDNAAAMRYCVTGDTLIKTDNGLVEIQDLINNSELDSDNDLDIKVLSLGQNENRASKFFNSGKHNIYELKTKEGYSVRGSSNHPVLTIITNENNEEIHSWKTLDKINLDDRIVIDRSEVLLNDAKISQQEKNISIIAGCLVSQGFISKNKLSFKSNDKIYFDNFIQAWKDEFGDSFETHQEEFSVDLDNLKDSDKLINSSIYKEIISIKSEDRRVPKFIFKGSKEAQDIFLQYLFEGNGSLSQVNYSTISSKLAKDIQILLLEFGVIVKITEDEDRVNINSLEEELVNKNYYYASVKSCEKTDYEEVVYSIKVDSECHSFVANGLINHNTEARMTRLSEDILKDIEKDTVDFTPNYDDSLSEPDVLPSRIPNLLLNGSSGIAVGMATNIPPHRLDELIEALMYRIDNENCAVEDLMNFVKAPDFPTGGIIFGRKGITDAYTTGRGRIKVRAKTHLEEKGNRDVIVIDELPYQVNKSRLIENIAQLVRDKSIEGISEIRDESDRDGIRVVMELKRDAMSEIVLNHLFKSTQMQITFGIIMLSIVNKEPKILNLMELLDIFLNHRKTVIIRRTIFELEKAKSRVHLLEGLKISVGNIDEVIKIIKESDDSEVAKLSLIQNFNLSEIQASAILEMKLRRLTGLEQEKIDNELTELKKVIAHLESILESEGILNKIIKDELTEIGEKFNSPRLTEVVDDYDDIDIEDLIVNEPMVVTITHRGYIKRVAIKQYEKQKRGGKGKTAITTYNDDFIEEFFISNTHDTLMFVTNLGQLYWLKVYRIPEGSRIAKGKAVVNLINLQQDEKIMAIIPTDNFDDSKSLAFFTKNGIVKRTALSEFSNIRSNGVRAIVLDEGDEVVTAEITLSESKYIMIFTALGQVIRFDIEKTRNQGRNTRGSRGIKFKNEDDFVVDADIIENEEQELLTVSENGVGKRTEVNAYRLTNRAGSGVISMKLSRKTGKTVVGNVLVDESQDLMALTSIGKMIRVDMQTIRKAGRNTSGVNIVNVDKDDKVVSIARCPKEEKSVDEINEEGLLSD